MVSSFLQINAKSNAGASPDILDTVSRALLYSVVVIVPLAVFPAALDQAFAIKYLLLKIITAILTGLFICKAITNGAKVGVSGLGWLILAFIALITVSAYTSVHLPTSLDGTHLRYDGFYSYVIYALLFFFSVQYLAKREYFETFIKLAALTAGLVSVYGIGQRFGIDPITWGFASFDTSRSFATFGNPITLAAYLSLMLPVSAGLLINSKTTENKALYSGSTLVIALCLFITMGRAAWLGALIGLAAMAVIVVKRSDFGIRIAAAPAIIALTAIVLGLVSVGVPTFTSRFTSVFDAGGSTLSRLLMWKGALEMIAHRPFFGFGPDALGLVFSRHESLELAKIAPHGIQDNVHNAFLQLAATCGIPALLVFIAIITILLLKAIRYVIEENASPLVIGLLGGVIAFSVQSFTGVTGIASSSFLWLGMGALAANWSQEAIEIRPPRYAAKYLAVGMIAGLVLLDIVGSVKPFLSDIALGQARLAERYGDLKSAETLYKRATKYNPLNGRAYRELAIMLADAGASTKNASMWVDSTNYLIPAENGYPDSQTSLTIGQVYFYGAKNFDASYYKDAEKHLLKALQLKPYSFIANGMLGAVYLETGRLYRAKERLDLALEIKPNDPQAHYVLGRYYERSGQAGRAIEEYKTSLGLDPSYKKASEAYERLAKDGN